MSSQQNTYGVIISIKDMIAEVSGLGSAGAGEVVETRITKGIVINMQENILGVVFFTDVNLTAREIVWRSFKIPTINTTLLNLGNVLNSLGLELENSKKYSNFIGLCSIYFQNFNTFFSKLEVSAPDIISRQSVYEPCSTGLTIIDSIIPVGQGQRELIIGDRQTGKTSIAVDAILKNR